MRLAILPDDMRWPSVVEHWGTTPQERALPQPCDALVPDPDLVLHRGTDVAAPPAVAFRWLCQLRTAPYSYDLIDNLGRRSPRELTPGLERLEVGQRINTIFAVTSFEPGRQITMLTASRHLGRVGCTYRVDPDADPARADRCRLVVRFLVTLPPRQPLRALMAATLPPGDLVMMRKQLLTLSQLAERDSRRR